MCVLKQTDFLVENLIKDIAIFQNLNIFFNEGTDYSFLLRVPKIARNLIAKNNNMKNFLAIRDMDGKFQ